MKGIFFSTVILLCLLMVKSQVVKWKYSVRKASEQKYEVHMKDKIEDEWDIYFQNIPDDGLVPTEMKFSKN